MATIDGHMRSLFDSHRADAKYVPFATASKDGVPNVVPVGMIWIENDREIWIVDNFLNKTLANIRENPVGSVYLIGGGKECLQVKGGIRYLTAGPDYDKARAFAKSKNEAFPAKGLVKLAVTDVYDTTSGPGAGRRYERDERPVRPMGPAPAA